MKKRTKSVVALILCTVMIMSFTAVGASAASPISITFPSNAASVSVYMGNERVLKDQAAIINSVTYVSLRGFCDLVGGCTVSWNNATKTATVVKGSTTITVTNGDVYILANGRCLYTSEKIRIISDRICVPVRPIAKALGVEVEWNGNSRSVILTKTSAVLASADSFYNQTDLYWLSRIISAESRGEPLIGQIAVGNVVLNRKASKSYPNTVYGVIFDKVGGVQFSPVSYGTIYNTPAASSVIAAKICLEGYSLSDDILYFFNPRIATSSWIANNCKYEFTIGTHDFYS